eukprot:CAMPEP_0182877042 /NCGR_PEP_ID=MMETSP0034_2-20130328/14512_1 /TAXON_ID=156128 /ORGANISM="Nephroselmis pyriformis, Strain CCMP717" /LENGTH=518 /DNA_ID=CAMNT_0025009863 /DNA_START=3 /DNA_END=1555 /DNA_ORIENTATION=+
MADGLPQSTFFLKTPEGVSFHHGPPGDVSAKESQRLLAPQVEYNKDGSLIAAAGTDKVTIHDADTMAELGSLPVPNAMALAWSPKSTFITTWSKPSSGKDNSEKNLQVWDRSTGECVFKAFQKSFQRDYWPSMQFSDDEATAIRLVTNEVHVHDATADLTQIARKLRLDGVGAAALAPGGKPLVACYVPEIKGAPASVRIYDHTQFQVGPGKQEAPQPLARRSFFKSSSVTFDWNATGTAVLVLASCDVDKTNQSYYGEQNLHFLAADGSEECGVDCKEGPIHDVKWSPTGDFFIVVHGFMPAKSTLFSSTCKAVYDMGSAARNTVRWSPTGRFFCLGGFGNLPGELEFYEKTARSARSIGKIKAPCTVSCEWGPDGRHLLTATTAPRLRVDNGYKIYKYNGELVHKQDMECLYQAAWRPAPVEVYPNRPMSPGAKGAVDSAKAAAPFRPSAYRPPHATGGSSAQFSMGYDKSETKPGKIPAFRPSMANNLPPGAEPAKAPSKNAKKRAKKKAGGGEG